MHQLLNKDFDNITMHGTNVKIIFIHFESLLHMLQGQYPQNVVGEVTKFSGRHPELFYFMLVSNTWERNTLLEIQQKESTSHNIKCCNES